MPASAFVRQLGPVSAVRTSFSPTEIVLPAPDGVAAGNHLVVIFYVDQNVIDGVEDTAGNSYTALETGGGPPAFGVGEARRPGILVYGAKILLPIAAGGSVTISLAGGFTHGIATALEISGLRDDGAFGALDDSSGKFEQTTFPSLSAIVITGDPVDNTVVPDFYVGAVGWYSAIEDFPTYTHDLPAGLTPATLGTAES